MVTTHAAVGVALATVLLPIGPEFTTTAAVAGLLGGAFPDLDVLFEHRKTLHFPVYYWVATVPTGLLALVSPSTATVAVLFFLLAAAVHSVMDVFGGPRDWRPWEHTSNRAVYLHYRRRWLVPRSGIRYDGAPEDLLVAAVCSLPGLVLFDGTLQTVTIVGLGISLVYTVFRKQIPAFVDA
ncbi:metal-dependent hydrolase [Halorubrum sp. Atlit-26R]|uniref:metal-dependent hydrolase n=1 Tax=Halorubrum sp. Atlit-26R TaxID=2282128 RepID=UPI003744068C